MGFVLRELEKNGVSLEILELLSFKSQLGKSLKNTLRRFEKDAIIKEIMNVIEFYQDNNLLDQTELDYRIKSIDSCLRKYERYYPSTEIEKVFNDLLGCRLLVDDYSYIFQDALPSQMRLVDMRDGKAKNDGYRGIHLYFQIDHSHYPIEIQINSYYDRQLNNWLHKYLYKRNYPDGIGNALREAYEYGKIKNEKEFQEVLNNVLSDRKTI